MKDLVVLTSVLTSLLTALHNLGDATKLIVAYYENIPKRIYERNSLEEKAEESRNAEADLVAGLGPLDMEN